MNLSYFTDRNILITLLLSLLSGVIMMGMIFVPQFCENALKISSGSGGYMVIILGVFAGIGAPISGKLIDKFGPKKILGFGFLVSIAGSLFLIFVTTRYSNFVTVCIALIFMGLGIGFTMGTPLNYMMLANTREKEANSALATLSLIRSIGTAVAPAIMAGFLAAAGSNLQSGLMKQLPTTVSIPSLAYETDINNELAMLKSDESMAAMFKNVTIPDFSTMNEMKLSFDGNSSYQLPDSLITKLQESDVTTIVGITKEVASAMFDEMTPSVEKQIQDNVGQGIDGISGGISAMQKNPAADPNTIQMMETLKMQLTKLKEDVPSAFSTAEKNYLKKIDKKADVIETTYQKILNVGFKNIYKTTATCSVLAFLLLLFGYREKKKDVKKVGNAD